MKNDIIDKNIIEIKKCKTKEEYIKLDALIEKTVKAIISNPLYVISYKEDFKYLLKVILEHFNPEKEEIQKINFMLRKLK